ncbi:Uncharacterised protein [Vibrio cholerae]|uniref:Uncharacterized protein n=1 Tax=Vibrio cholerae TaxID=666 RepID=A0A655XGZ2_VIBCL|nr:Uncharacterised protein [Vibrio cholerae]CSB58785.1 Uncharacterised protein [Vibrio cholerae]CSC13487.1 Uncharacterised protein [Vibrio cholerae]CSD00153.1 Uncharacterised protein [Vibrio cholerae]CSD07453.1 Uncharacterised protein [Vibrio cholerae]
MSNVTGATAPLACCLAIQSLNSASSEWAAKGNCTLTCWLGVMVTIEGDIAQSLIKSGCENWLSQRQRSCLD